MPQVLITFCKVLSLAFSKALFLHLPKPFPIIAFLPFFVSCLCHELLFVYPPVLFPVCFCKALDTCVHPLPAPYLRRCRLYYYYFFVLQRLCRVTDLPGKSCVVYAAYEAVDSILEEVVQIIPVFFCSVLFLIVKANHA